LTDRIGGAFAGTPEAERVLPCFEVGKKMTAEIVALWRPDPALCTDLTAPTIVAFATDLDLVETLFSEGDLEAFVLVGRNLDGEALVGNERNFGQVDL